MADQNDQQTPAQPPTASQEVITATETGMKSLIKNLWSKYGILFILVGVVLLAAKFNDVIMSILGWSSKKDLQNAQKTDAQLKAQEDAANQQADSLVKQANELPSKEEQVTDDWYQKKGN